ncbi:hypothetical protein DFH09DRAFT_1080478 [Mycena vulgaris]|nr:hypothetical protein DFH09DRAFT_1080478 [Mycena vulgaris]
MPSNEKYQSAYGNSARHNYCIPVWQTGHESMLGVPSKKSGTSIPVHETQLDIISSATIAPATTQSLFVDFNALIPSTASPADPLQDFMDLYGSGAFFDAGAPADFGSFTAGSSDEPLPLLPPPPPESPPALAPPVEQALEPDPNSPKSHRPQNEVDEVNILYTTRPRAVTACKRYGDGDDVFNRPKKKCKANVPGLRECTVHPAECTAHRMYLRCAVIYLPLFVKIAQLDFDLPDEIWEQILIYAFGSRMQDFLKYSKNRMFLCLVCWLWWGIIYNSPRAWSKIPISLYSSQQFVRFRMESAKPANREVAQKSLEPSHGLFGVRTQMAPPAKL